MSDDYYDILGVSRDANDSELKKAYRRLAMRYHPDRGKGDKEEREENFKRVSEAYAVLSDREKRSLYDQYGKEGLQGAGGHGFDFGSDAFGDIFKNFDDVFGSVFGGRRGSRQRSYGEPGEDLQMAVSISLEQAARGDNVEVNVNALRHCGECQGTGAQAGSSPTTCPSCEGSGRQAINRGFLQVATTCSRCGGSGEIIQNPCKTCRGEGRLPSNKTLSVSIPPGIDDGMRLRVTGEGGDGLRGGPVGDLYIVFDIKPHQTFTRDGANLYCAVPISFTQATLGSDVEVRSLDGKFRIKIPEGTQSGREFRLRGKGMPVLRSQRHGDLICTVVVETPRALSSKQKKLLEEFQASLDERPQHHHPKTSGWFEELKGFFNSNGNAA